MLFGNVKRQKITEKENIKIEFGTVCLHEYVRSNSDREQEALGTLATRELLNRSSLASAPVSLVMPLPAARTQINLGYK